MGFPPAAQATPAGPHDVHAQPTLVGQPGRPQPANPYAQPAAYPVLGPPPPTGGGAGRAALWAVAGAVAASAAWAAGVFLIGAGADPDLRGYASPSNLCNSTDYTSFKEEYTQSDSSPVHNSLEDDALDERLCNLSLKKSGSSYTDAYLYVQLDLHRKTDPGPEFTATWKNYGDSHSGYDVETVSGLGDEAYLVSDDNTSGSSSGSLYATLAVRDGWVTYTMSYSAYYSSYSDTDPPTLADVSGWLKADSKSTLDDLRG